MNTLARMARMAAVVVTRRTPAPAAPAPTPEIMWEPIPGDYSPTLYKMTFVPPAAPVEVRTRSGRILGYVRADESSRWDAFRR